MPPFKFYVLVGALATAVARATGGGHAQVVLSTDDSPMQQPLVPVAKPKTLEKARECFDTCFGGTAVTVKPAANVFLVRVFEQGALSPEDEALVGDDRHKRYYNKMMAQYNAIMGLTEKEHAKDEPCD